jgi:hypothetical protein
MKVPFLTQPSSKWAMAWHQWAITCSWATQTTFIGGIWMIWNSLTATDMQSHLEIGRGFAQIYCFGFLGHQKMLLCIYHNIYSYIGIGRMWCALAFVETDNKVSYLQAALDLVSRFGWKCQIYVHLQQLKLSHGLSLFRLQMLLGHHVIFIVHIWLIGRRWIWNGLAETHWYTWCGWWCPWCPSQ